MGAWEWLWRGQALARAKSAAAASSATEQRRAKVTAKLGQSALETNEPEARAEAQAVSAGLFADSIVWSLRWFARAGQPSTQEPAELADLVQRFAPRLLEACEGDHDALERLTRRLLTRRFEDVSTPSLEVALASAELSAVARRLQRASADPEGPVRIALAQRLRRLALAFVLVPLAICGLFIGMDRLERWRDLSRGRPWLASSSTQVVCVSPARSCPLSGFYFFHTLQEASPWLELDLGQVQKFSSVKVFNRLDCCADRAVPLVIEVSDDRKAWRQVARRDAAFAKWTAKLGPTSARWVRLRVTRSSFLHLFDVRVLP